MIVLDHVSIEQDAFRMQDVCIEVPRGAYAVLMGATGSGKTTTLYSALNELNAPEVKILTAEDPVEYDIDGLIQVQAPDLDFHSCQRLL